MSSNYRSLACVHIEDADAETVESLVKWYNSKEGMRNIASRRTNGVSIKIRESIMEKLGCTNHYVLLKKGELCFADGTLLLSKKEETIPPAQKPEPAAQECS